MKNIKRFMVLSFALLALAACGLRDNPAVPPAHGTSTSAVAS
jgi:predicted small lipoprotein YifL